jgi:IMP dehydrogenase
MKGFTMSKLSEAPIAYTFDDFYLAPVHSTIRSRRDPDLSVWVDRFRCDVPIVSSPMNTVTGSDMARTMAKVGGVAVLHRYMSVTDQVAEAVGLISEGVDVWVAVGANGDSEERVAALSAAGVTAFCIDVANGHSVHCIEAVTRLRTKLPDARIMAGNVCTYDGAYRLAEAGADAIRVGIGPGSMCTTRLVTGHGVPQLSAIEDCARIKLYPGDPETEMIMQPNYYPDVAIIADGGIRGSGDIVKALAIGADAVMLGSLLAGTSETPGDTHKDPVTGALYKYYHGMASVEGRASWFDRQRTSFVPEGESTKIPHKGSTEKVLETLLGGVRSGLSYAGAMDIKELREKAQWRRVTSAGMTEARPHGKL